MSVFMKEPVPCLTLKGYRIYEGGGYPVLASISLLGDPAQVARHIQDSVERLRSVKLKEMNWSVLERDAHLLIAALCPNGPMISVADFKREHRMLYGYPLLIKQYQRVDPKGPGQPPVIHQRRLRG